VAVRLPAPASLLLVVISNPLWIALTAPGRWVSDRFRTPLILGPPSGAAAVAGMTLNLIYLFSGSSGVNPAYAIVAVLLILA
jgi:hypothetical protein